MPQMNFSLEIIKTELNEDGIKWSGDEGEEAFQLHCLSAPTAIALR